MTDRLADRLQTVIQRIYRLDAAASVVDFCVGKEALNALFGEGTDQRRRESLIVAEDGDETLVGLYLDEHLMMQAWGIIDGGEAESLSVSDLDSLCVVIEGVSHFVYFTYCGGVQDRPVSQLELELQAEIDKFLVLRELFRASGLPLIAQLFDQIRLCDTLNDEEVERYTVANREAKRYAKWLDREFSAGRGDQAVDHARDLYRSSISRKLESISKAA